MPDALRPLVSVIIPTYNYARFVVQAVESALKQTYKNVEIIVIDDGSTDDTPQRLEPFFNRIRYIQQRNQGLAASRNNGIDLATGELVAFLDSDDYWHPRKLELQVAYLAENPDVGLIAARHRSDPRDPWPELSSERTTGALRFTLKQLVLRTRFNPSGVVARKACLDAIGQFDPALPGTEDRDLWIRAADRFGVAMLDATLWHYRVHGTNMSNRAAVMEASERRTIWKAFETIPALSGRRLLCRKAMSYVVLSSSHTYDAASLRGKALAKMIESFILWPLPLDRADVKTSFVRPKRLITICLRMLGLKSPDREQFGGTPESSAVALARAQGIT